MNLKKLEKNNIKNLKRKNNTNLALKLINWIWNFVLKLFLLPHSFDDCNSKSLRRDFIILILVIICDYWLLIII